jgi:hypothetical protein
MLHWVVCAAQHMHAQLSSSAHACAPPRMHALCCNAPRQLTQPVAHALHDLMAHHDLMVIFGDHMQHIWQLWTPGRPSLRQRWTTLRPKSLTSTWRGASSIRRSVEWRHPLCAGRWCVPSACLADCHWVALRHHWPPISMHATGRRARR